MALKFKTTAAFARYLTANCEPVASVKLRKGETVAEASARLDVKAERLGCFTPRKQKPWILCS